MKYPTRSQYKHAKSQYRVRNWSEYEAGLQRRGDLTVWLSDDALSSITDPVASVSADGVYDSKAVFEAVHEQG